MTSETVLSMLSPEAMACLLGFAPLLSSQGVGERPILSDTPQAQYSCCLKKIPRNPQAAHPQEPRPSTSQIWSLLH